MFFEITSKAPSRITALPPTDAASPGILGRGDCLSPQAAEDASDIVEEAKLQLLEIGKLDGGKKVKSASDTRIVEREGV